MSARQGSPESALITVGWVLIAMAALAALIVILSAVRQYRQLSLPTVAGVMIDCKTLLKSSSGEHGAGGTSSFSGMWVIEASFSYRVEGVSYIGKRFSQRPVTKIDASAGFDPPPEMAQICERYSAGTTVQVHFRPDSPQQSFVYFHSPLKAWPWSIPAMVFAVLGIVALANAHRVR